MSYKIAFFGYRQLITITTQSNYLILFWIILTRLQPHTYFSDTHSKVSSVLGLCYVTAGNIPIFQRYLLPESSQSEHQCKVNWYKTLHNIQTYNTHNVMLKKNANWQALSVSKSLAMQSKRNTTRKKVRMLYTLIRILKILLRQDVGLYDTHRRKCRMHVNILDRNPKKVRSLAD